MPNCKIRVLRCLFDAELKQQYVPDPNYGPCPYFSVGFETISDGEKPEDFSCQIAWRSIRDDVALMVSDHPVFQQHIVCCTDGIRPVIFELTRLD